MWTLAFSTDWKGHNWSLVCSFRIWPMSRSISEHILAISFKGNIDSWKTIYAKEH